MSDLQCAARLYVVWPASPDLDPTALVPPGDPGAAVHRMEAGERLGDVADRHRGEAVLVVVDRALVELPALSPGDLVALEVDGDGMRRL